MFLSVLSFPSENFQKGGQVELWFLTVKYQAYSANEIIFPGTSQFFKPRNGERETEATWEKKKFPRKQ